MSAPAVPRLLQVGLAGVMLLNGLDKFFFWLTDWSVYQAPFILNFLRHTRFPFYTLLGVAEIAIGLLVAFIPRIGGYVAAAWLAGITLNLLFVPGYYNIIVLNVGLLLAGIALSRSARKSAP